MSNNISDLEKVVADLVASAVQAQKLTGRARRAVIADVLGTIRVLCRDYLTAMKELDAIDENMEEWRREKLFQQLLAIRKVIRK